MPPTHQTYSFSSGYPTPGRPPLALTALGNRIRSLQRTEPNVAGSERIEALRRLARLDVRLERLALTARRPDADQRNILAEAFAVAEQVDALARLWPEDGLSRSAATGGRRHLVTGTSGHPPVGPMDHGHQVA